MFLECMEGSHFDILELNERYTVYKINIKYHHQICCNMFSELRSHSQLTGVFISDSNSTQNLQIPALLSTCGFQKKFFKKQGLTFISVKYPGLQTFACAADRCVTQTVCLGTPSISDSQQWKWKITTYTTVGLPVLKGQGHCQSIRAAVRNSKQQQADFEA